MRLIFDPFRAVVFALRYLPAGRSVFCRRQIPTANGLNGLTVIFVPLANLKFPLTTDYRPLTTDYRPLITDYRPLTTDYRPLTTDYRPLTTDWMFPALKRRAESCSPRGAKTLPRATE
jgi:hypothetical protein